jgi:hypothetical protein
MHWMQMEVYRSDGADRAGGEQSVKASKAVKAGRTCQSSWNSSEVDGLIKMCWRWVKWSEHWNMLQANEASEALECIRGAQSVTTRLVVSL